MTDAPKPEQPTPPAETRGGRSSGQQFDFSDPRRGNWASRLFPGPTKEMSEESAQQMRDLLRSYREQAGSRGNRDANGHRTRPQANQGAVGQDATKQLPAAPLGVPATAATAAASSEDVAALQKAADDQNELLRALLSNAIDTQQDARTTAQNSRTFAWAGTAIAVLTLIATVVAVVVALKPAG